MSGKKKVLITYLALFAIAALIVGMTVSFQLGSLGGGMAALTRCLSDGCFTAGVLYLGCGVLMLIQNAGNFYGISFLFHTMAQDFSAGKGRLGGKKDYYTYCAEKRERRKAEGKSPLQSAMLILGAALLLLSLAFVALFYKLS